MMPTKPQPVVLSISFGPRQAFENTKQLIRSKSTGTRNSMHVHSGMEHETAHMSKAKQNTKSTADEEFFGFGKKCSTKL